MLDKTPRSKLGPIELEVIHGTIRAAELEIEAAVERTARSPMIRDQHDYRVALFDAKGRKLTGRSYSAIVEPVFAYFGDDIQQGDVFFWNDPYNSCGGIGHVPDLCTTVPIFHGDRLIGFSQVFGHHDDVGGSVPGSLPVHATELVDGGHPRPADQALRSGEAQPGGVPDHHPELAALGAPRRRHGCRDRRCPPRLAPHRGARRTLRGRRARGRLRPDPEKHGGGLPARDPAEDQGRGLSLRGLYRGRRGRRAAPPCAPPDHDQDGGQDRPRFQRHRPGGQRADQLVARRGRGTLFPEVAGADAPLARRLAGARRRDRFQRGRARRRRGGVSAEGDADHAELRQADRHALLPDAPLARGLRGVPVEGDRRTDAGGPRDHPHLGADRRADAEGLLPLPRGARRRQSGTALGRRFRRRPHCPKFEEPAGGILRDALPDPHRAARAETGFGRRRLPPRRPRLRQAHPRARGLPADLQRRPLAPRLLRRQWRQGRPQLPGLDHRRRGEGNRLPRHVRHGDRQGGRGRAHRHHRRRRLGRSAPARDRPGGL